MVRLMKIVILLFIMIVTAGSLTGIWILNGEVKKSGEALFKEYCTCHPDGKNEINPKKTFGKKDLESNKISKPADIVKIMRNPGRGMVTFDAETISEKDAMEIAEYILKIYNK